MSHPQVVSDRAWQEWSHHPVTKLWQSQMREDLARMQELWVGGSFTSESCDATAQANAKAIGAAQTLRSMIEKIEELQQAAEGIEQ